MNGLELIPIAAAIVLALFVAWALRRGRDQAETRTEQMPNVTQHWDPGPAWPVLSRRPFDRCWSGTNEQRRSRAF